MCYKWKDGDDGRDDGRGYKLRKMEEKEAGRCRENRKTKKLEILIIGYLGKTGLNSVSMSSDRLWVKNCINVNIKIPKCISQSRSPKKIPLP